MKIFISLVIFAAIASSASANKRCFPLTEPKPTPDPHACPANEIFDACGANGCQNTCANPTLSQVCRATCIPGCICADGFIRDANNVCVLASACPSLNVCNVNEVYSDCGANSCQPSCSVKSLAAAGLACRPSCTPGCICADGYFHDDNGVCVLEADCPVSTVCAANEEFTDCGTACQKTCANKFSPMICTKQCVQGCFCTAGYVRDADNVCVLESDCPAPALQCGQNEKLDSCTSLCVEATCASQISRFCGAGKCQPKCLCADGFIRDEPNGVCIKSESCPVAM